MKQLQIETPSTTYPVYIGQGIRFKLKKLINDNQLAYSHYFIISDEHVAPLYLNDIIEGIDKQVDHFIIPAGEVSKSFESYQALLTKILLCRPDRNSCIIALGGGVVGDLAGFVAATLLRGIGFIQMPTTVLAHDSSVGGKVGINHSTGKNLIGSFYHPDMVVYDTDTLKSLTSRDLVSGFAEVIKHALINEKSFYLALKQHYTTQERLQKNSLDDALYKAIQVKASIVNQDEREHGVRTYLNFGHTLGHALEKECGYGVLTHGEAISIGMIFAMALSESYYSIKLPKDDIIEWFSQLHLPTQLPNHIDKKQILNTMYHDKKTMNGVLRFVLMKDIGDVEIVQVDTSIVEYVLSKF